MQEGGRRGGGGHREKGGGGHREEGRVEEGGGAWGGGEGGTQGGGESGGGEGGHREEGRVVSWQLKKHPKTMSNLLTSVVLFWYPRFWKPWYRYSSSWWEVGVFHGTVRLGVAWFRCISGEVCSSATGSVCETGRGEEGWWEREGGRM